MTLMPVPVDERGTAGPCPRDQATLVAERLHGLSVMRCPVCTGLWLDGSELDALEATRADEDDRRGMIEYSPHPSELACPTCGASMTGFEYRGYGLILEECAAQHGYWLDAGEDERVLDIIQERVRGLRRLPAAEAAWTDLRLGGGGGLMSRLRRFFER